MVNILLLNSVKYPRYRGVPKAKRDSLAENNYMTSRYVWYLALVGQLEAGLF